MSKYCKNCYELIKQLDQLKADNDSFKSELMQTNCYLEADNETIDQLKKENEKLKNTVMQKCPQCGEIYLNPIGAKLYEALVEIKEIANYSFNLSTSELMVKLEQILQKINEVLE